MIFQIAFGKDMKGGLKIPHPKPKDIPRNESNTKNMPSVLCATLQIDLGG